MTRSRRRGARLVWWPMEGHVSGVPGVTCCRRCSRWRGLGWPGGMASTGAVSGEGGGTSRGEGRGRCAPMVVPFGSLREGSCAHMVEAPCMGTGFDGGHACVPVYTVVTGVVGQRWASSACGTCWGASARVWGGSQGSYRLPERRRRVRACGAERTGVGARAPIGGPG